MQNAVQVTFTIKMETVRAYIVNDIKINGKPFIKECNLPKSTTEIVKTTKSNVTTANVEEWVLRQRKQEEQAQPQDSASLAQSLLNDFADDNAPF